MNRTEIDTLYRQYGPLVLRRARAILGEEQAAKDALQEVFMRTIGSFAAFRNESSPATWLYRVTTNHCLNQIRNASRQGELLAERVRPDSRTGATDDRLAVAQLLARIPEELREIAVYYFVDEMNQDEIADVLGVSRRTIGNRLDEFRAAAGLVWKEVS